MRIGGWLPSATFRSINMTNFIVLFNTKCIHSALFHSTCVYPYIYIIIFTCNIEKKNNKKRNLINRWIISWQLLRPVVVERNIFPEYFVQRYHIGIREYVKLFTVFYNRDDFIWVETRNLCDTCIPLVLTTVENYSTLFFLNPIPRDFWVHWTCATRCHTSLQNPFIGVVACP